MGEEGIGQFISYPAKNEKVPATTQNQAIKIAIIVKQESCHASRHSFATQLFESGYDIKTILELSGHKNVETTIIHTHVINQGGKGIRSPTDLFV